MISLGSTVPNTSSQHNQSGLIDELLTQLTTQLPSCRRFSPSQITTAAHIVFENGVKACLPHLCLCKRFSTLKQERLDLTGSWNLVRLLRSISGTDWAWILVQVDDDIVKHYSNEDVCLIEVTKVDEELCDVTLVEV
ncbi:hypothetical protein TNCV_4734331 [Trichonephila clavipes]|nr:hypothetical protein TNCV_4734331 [Trichonephila clavipes]